MTSFRIILSYTSLFYPRKIMINLETENLTLRSLIDSDRQTFLQMHLDTEINRYIRPPEDQQQILVKFDERKQPWDYKSGSWLTLTIEDKQGAFVGYSGFHCIDTEYNDVEVGYIMHPNAQGKGYATEALKRIVSWGVQQYQIRKFIAYCDVENIGSQRVLQKTGFQQEGLLREHVKNGERWVDDCVFGLLSREIV